MVAGVSARDSSLVLREKGKKMTEVITNPEEQSQDDEQQTEEKLRQKIVYADETALAAYKAGSKNKTLPAAVHPALYAASVEYAYNNIEGSQDKEGGRIALKPGALSDLVRLAVSKLVGYTGELAITTSRQTSAERLQIDAFRGTAATVFMFARLQAMGDPEAEAQAKRNAFAVMMKRKEKLAPSMVVTEEDLEAMWQEEA